MGEKIRDIHPIKIGTANLMVELNEGYTKEQGKVIHIQNKYFRFLLKADDFFHFCSEILRSKSEFDYIKEKPPLLHKAEDFIERSEVKANTYSIVKKLCKMLDNNNIDYRVIDIDNSYVLFIIKDLNYQEFVRFTKKYDLKKIKHPLGRLFNYVFLYQMRPFELFKYNDDFFVDVMFQLPCYSMTPNTWIPLDKTIQSRIWTNVKMIDSCKYLDDISNFIFIVSWSFFYNHGFSNYARKLISKLFDDLDEMELERLLNLVFFSYTPQLISYLHDNEFDLALIEYFTYKDY